MTLTVKKFWISLFENWTAGMGLGHSDMLPVKSLVDSLFAHVMMSIPAVDIKISLNQESMFINRPVESFCNIHGNKGERFVWIVEH